MPFLNYLILSLVVLNSFYFLFKKKQKIYTINKFLWLYILIFWGIVPLIQYSLNSFPWGVNVTPILSFKANLLILTWILTYSFCYKIFFKKNDGQYNSFSIYPFKISKSGITLLIAFQLGILLFFFSRSGNLNFLRGEATGSYIGSNQSTHLIISQVFRAFSTFASLVVFYNFSQNKTKRRFIAFLISFTLLLLTNFPLAIARYMAGAFYLAFVFLFKPNFKRKNIPIYFLLFLFLIIYPSLSAIRYLTSFQEFQLTGTTLQTFLSGDFDNYSTLNMTIAYVQDNGATWGQQLFGVLFFFIPRSIWPSKPIGSGAFIAESARMDFTNISCPYVAEGYINFGILGVILFAIAMAFFVAKLDTKFYTYSKLNFIKIFYPVALGMIFFILRGDLMSSFAYTISFVVAAFLVYLSIKPFLRH